MMLVFKKGDGALTLPASCMSAAASADANDLRLLLYIAACESEEKAFDVTDAAEALSLGEAEINASVKYWCGAGVLKKGKPQKESAELQKTVRRRALVQNKEVSFTSNELCEIAEMNGDFKELTDMAQQTAGWMFNTKDIEVIADLYSNLMLSSEYILALIGYFVKKREKPLRYLVKVANDYINDGIDSAAALEERLQWLEKFDGRAGKVRSMFGMGAREFSKKEKEFLAHWFDELKVSDELLEKAYEITVDNTGKASFSYINRVLENWHNDGVKKPSDIVKNTKAPQKAGKTTRAGTAAARTFDPDEAFKKALERSYNGENK